MAAEMETMSALEKRKRKQTQKKGNKGSKKMRVSQRGAPKRRNPTERMKKLFRKRAKDYNSDDECEEEEEEDVVEDESVQEEEDEEEESGFGARGSDTDGDDEGESDGDGRRHAVGTKLVEGSRAFKIAFVKIMKLNLPKDDPLGPILSAHKKLVAEKLAEEEEEHKAKKAAKKEKQLAAEKGHVKPDNFLDVKEKSLISIATKGVVKLFNAVSKAQSSQKGLDPSRSKDAKVMAKQRKQAFFTELRKSTTQIPGSTSMDKNDEPGWAPLRDNYMLTSSKLKDWDKKTDSAPVVGQENVSMGSSSDEE